MCLDSKWFALLGDDLALPMIKRLDKDYQSFFRSHELRKKGIIHTQISRPAPKDESSHAFLIVSAPCVKEGKAVIPLSAAFRKKFKISELLIDLPIAASPKGELVELRIHRSNSGEYFWAECIFECISDKKHTSTPIDVIFHNGDFSTTLMSEKGCCVVQGDFLAYAHEWYTAEIGVIDSLDYPKLYRTFAKYEKIIDKYLSNTARIVMNQALSLGASKIRIQPKHTEINSIPYSILLNKLRTLSKKYKVVLVDDQYLGQTETNTCHIISAEFLNDTVFKT